MALGSALALFLYPHSMTGVLSLSSRDVIRRNTAMLPAYSFLLALIAAPGYMALAAGVDKNLAYAAGFARYDANFAVPALFLDSFPSWFVGSSRSPRSPSVRLRARRDHVDRRSQPVHAQRVPRVLPADDASGQEESTVAKVASLIVKFGALAFIVLVPQKFAIQFQLARRRLDPSRRCPPSFSASTRDGRTRGALLAGWVAGMGVGTYMASELHFKATVFPLHVGPLTIPGHAALWALLVNLAVVAIIATFVLDAAGVARGEDVTRPEDYGPA